MAIRKFWLVNGLGKKYDLTDIYQSAFLNAPSGLGVSATVQVTRLGNSQKASSYQFGLEPLEGTLLFKKGESNSTSYYEYQKFFNFVNHLPLYFHQQTPNMIGESYHCEVLLTSLNKGEVSKDTSFLEVPVQFQPLTFWQNDNLSVIEADKSAEVGKSYELKRPYHYSSIGYENMRVHNKSSTNIPIVIEIDGVAENPSFQLFDSQGVVYGVGKFLGTFDYVYIDSNDLTEEIKLSQGGGWLLNPYNYQDISIGRQGVYLTFVYVKPGENGFKFSFDNEFEGKVRISWRESYATV